MTPAIYVIVAASPDCVALLGAPPKMRFYEHGEAPPKPKPYAVWQMPTSVPANYLGQLPDADDSRIQIDVYADDQVTAEQTALALRAAIEPHADMLNSSKRTRDAVTRSYGYMLEFQFMEAR